MLQILVPPRIGLKITRFLLSSSSPGRSAKGTTMSLQRLMDLTRVATDAITKKQQKEYGQVIDSSGMIHNDSMVNLIKALGDRNLFDDLGKLLSADKRNTVDVRLIGGVINTACRAKDLERCPQSIIDWIEEHVPRVDHIHRKTERQLVWLLSCLRGDLQTLSASPHPEIEKDAAMRHAAVAYLREKKDWNAFCTFWSESGSSIIDDSDRPKERVSAAAHFALLNWPIADKRQVLTWYMKEVARTRKTPIPSYLFEDLVKPINHVYGGRLVTWTESDLTKRQGELVQWRSSFGEERMKKLEKALIENARNTMMQQKFANVNDLNVLIKTLRHLPRNKPVVVIDWLNYSFALHKAKGSTNMNFEKLFPGRFALIVTRLFNNNNAIPPPKESDNVRVVEVSKKVENKQENDDLCAMIASVVTRGHIVTNDKISPHLSLFRDFLKENNLDDTLYDTLLEFLEAATVRHLRGSHTQPVVDYSRSAQLINNNELIFTVSRVPKNSMRDSPYLDIDYYCWIID